MVKTRQNGSRWQVAGGRWQVAGMSHGGFEDLRVWQESMTLAVDVIRTLRSSREFALKNQMSRSAISVPSNIAEGYERRSNRDFIRFLRIAAGSNAELRTQIYLAKQVGEGEPLLADDFIKRSQTVAAQLSNLIKKRQSFD